MGRSVGWAPLLLPLFPFCHIQFTTAYSLQSPVGVNGGASKGAVASESRICSQIGIDLIERGGNAADAMVGTNLCVGVMSLYHSGIGGGGFMLVRNSDGDYETVDYRETAPAAAFQDMYRDNPLGSVFGGLAVGVPGELRGLEYLHQKYGSLPWRAVVHPAAHVAKNGFQVTEDIVRYMDAALQYAPTNFLVDDPSWAEDFAPNGTLVKLGDVITRKRYASTLEMIGYYGANIFYEGYIAKSMIKLIQATNGTMTLDDLKNYRVTTPRPVSVDYRGYRLWSTGAPSSGVVCLSILKTMEQYPASDYSDVNLTTHRFAEALRFGYGGRYSLGDPDYVPHIEQLESQMLSDSFAASIRSRILDNATQPVKAYDPHRPAGGGDDDSDEPFYYAPAGHGTSHIVTADASGMTVTSTTTVNLLFGSLLMDPHTGVVLNNEMNDFSIPGVRNEFGFEPSPPNYIRPGKRPLSSITPLVAEHANGTLVLSLGAAGGSRILSATCQAAWHVLEGGEDLARAVAAPRMHDQLMPNVVTFEARFDNSTVRSMLDKGHNVSWVPPIYSAVQGVQRLWDGTFLAAREVRQRNSGGLTT